MNTDDYLITVFDEITRTDVNFKTKNSRKKLSLLSFNDELNFDYNDCDSIQSLSRKLENLYHDFKSRLGKLASTGPKNLIYDRFFQIKIKIDEADVLINPRDKDLVFARITILGSSRLALTKPQIDTLKNILINYVQVQRSYLKLIKGTTKNIASFYAPELVLRYGKRKVKGQHTLFPPNSPKSLSWQSETIKLVELGAALAATKAFGPEVSRKQIWDFLSSSMSCPLDKAEQALSQMKHRKNSQLKFLDEMNLAMTDLLERGL